MEGPWFETRKRTPFLIALVMWLLVLFWILCENTSYDEDNTASFTGKVHPLCEKFIESECIGLIPVMIQISTPNTKLQKNEDGTEGPKVTTFASPLLVTSPQAVSPSSYPSSHKKGRESISMVQPQGVTRRRADAKKSWEILQGHLIKTFQGDYLALFPKNILQQGIMRFTKAPLSQFSLKGGCYFVRVDFKCKAIILLYWCINCTGKT
jgi:hypothetical protein